MDNLAKALITKQNWWAKSSDEVSQRLETDSQQGLSLKEVEQRQELWGFNVLPEAKKISPLKIFVNQFNNFIVWVLTGAATIAGFLGEWLDAGVILAIVVLNGFLGFFQEFRAEQSLQALKKLSTPTSKVTRNGELKEIPSKEIVPGDLVLVESGDHVPCDGRIIQAIRLRAQEAALTGESVPVNKHDETIQAQELPLGDRNNMAFLGTEIVNGKGKLIATGIGCDTELGKIASLLQTEKEKKTPLQERLEHLGTKLVWFFIGIVSIVFVVGLLRQNPLVEMLLTSLSLAVAAIPEGLPAVVTTALAFGVWKMAKRNALIRRLASVETLGCAQVICTDKTGTLTLNEMTVRQMWVNQKTITVTGTGYAPQGEFFSDQNKINPEEHPELLEALTIGVLCNNAALRKQGEIWQIVGDPTEAALLTLAAKADLLKDELDFEYPQIEEIPFDSERKRMSVLRKGRQGKKVYVKGALDILLQRANQILVNGKTVELTDEMREVVTKENSNFASKTYRVLALAYKEILEEDASSEEALETQLVFVGLVAMADPPRPEVKQAVESCKKAGITPVMITGDHKKTAMAIAQQIGLIDEKGLGVEGREIDSMSESELEERVESISVYARVSAENKLDIVRAWKRRGKVVAMTGDGVNDAPAIKEADIGVAMGVTGTDVTKEASDMVITDDNFVSIVNAVEEGRGVYDNITKFVKFLLSFNLAEIMVLFFGMLIGFKDAVGHAIIPLSAVQILWINLVTDGFPAVALGLDPVDPRAMKRKPRKKRESMFNREFMIDLSIISVLTAIGSLIACYIGSKDSGAMAQTMTMTTLVLMELVGIQIVRAKYQVSVFSNHWLILAVVLSFALQILILYVPPLQAAFGMVPIGLMEWGTILLLVGILWGVARGLSSQLYRFQQPIQN